MAVGVTSKRRAAILDAAVTLFRRHGYHGTGIAELGEAVGVTGPAIYRHFGSKADILVHAIIAGGEQLAEAAACLPVSEDPVERLRALLQSYVGVVASNPDLIAVFLLESRHLPSEGVARLDRRGRRYLREYVRLVRAIHPWMGEADAAFLVQAVLSMPTALCLNPTLLTEPRMQLLADRMLVALTSSIEPPAVRSEARRPR